MYERVPRVAPLHIETISTTVRKLASYQHSLGLGGVKRDAGIAGEYSGGNREGHTWSTGSGVTPGPANTVLSKQYICMCVKV